MSYQTDYLPAGAQTQIIEHTMVWHDGKVHTKDALRRRPYLSDDPIAMTSMCVAAAKRGVTIREPNWYGPQAGLTTRATTVLFDAAAKAGIHVMVNMDKGAYDTGAVGGHTIDLAKLRACIAYARKTWFPRENYFKGPDGKFWMSYFSYPGNEPAKFALIEHENPDITFHYTDPHYGKNSYAWVHHGSGVAGLDSWCRSYAQRTDGVFVPCVFKGFDDRYTDPVTHQVQSVWGGAPRVMINGNERDGQTLLDCFAILNKWYPKGPPFLRLVTANDADEGTTLEDDIENGVTLTAGLNQGVIQWTAGGNLNTVRSVELLIDDTVSVTFDPATSGSYELPTNVSLGTHRILARATGKTNFPTRTAQVIEATEFVGWR